MRNGFALGLSGSGAPQVLREPDGPRATMPRSASLARPMRPASRMGHLLDRLAGLVGTPGRAHPDEHAPIAGDELLPAARAQVTHHVRIEAPPRDVWPWLLQMGRRRGGWYSWDLLDNGGVRSADRIVPALQKLSVGDTLPIKRTGPEGFAVLAIEPMRALVLGDPSLLPGAPKPAGPARATWAFALEPIGDSATHLVVRVRVEHPDSLVARLLRPVVVAVHDVMERKQLRTLKQRAEAR